MKKETYTLLENYMLSCMDDSAHDREHVYRVLYNALDIAKTETNVDYDVLIAACLLHDIGRREQFENPAKCHAMVGSEKAYDFLMKQGFEEGYAKKVKRCIVSHRYRTDCQPETLEEKILFDADKLDATGAMGIARTLIYKGIVSEPLYSLGTDGMVSTGEDDAEPSFFQEYKYKLESLYSKFYTERAAEIAGERRKIAEDFYNCLYQEANASYVNGKREIDRIVNEE